MLDPLSHKPTGQSLAGLALRADEWTDDLNFGPDAKADIREMAAGQLWRTWPRASFHIMYKAATRDEAVIEETVGVVREQKQTWSSRVNSLTMQHAQQDILNMRNDNA